MRGSGKQAALMGADITTVSHNSNPYVYTFSIANAYYVFLCREKKVGDAYLHLPSQQRLMNSGLNYYELVNLKANRKIIESSRIVRMHVFNEM